MCGLLNPTDPFSAILLSAVNTIQIQQVKEPGLGTPVHPKADLTSITIAELNGTRKKPWVGHHDRFYKTPYILETWL